MSNVKIGGIVIGEGHPCFIVAEIGINHNGDVAIAKNLIDVAEAAGCNAVKFQKRTVDVVYTLEELAKPRESPFGLTNGDLKRRLEFGGKEYEEIDRYCRERESFGSLPAGTRLLLISLISSTRPVTKLPPHVSPTMNL